MTEVLMPESSSAPSSRREQLATTFEGYRSELDADNERRERLIILSRSTTQLSKKLIFHLHRGATLTSLEARSKNLQEARNKVAEIKINFGKIYDEIRGGINVESYWRWARQVSPGLEEYIEAISFLYYLEHASLIPLSEIQSELSDPTTGQPYVVVTPEDYVLGMSDLTGELMRYATNSLSTGDHEIPLAVCDFVRTVKTYFDGISPAMLYKLSKKQEETTRSLEKIEKVCYALRLRLVEYADRPEILRQMAKRALEDARDREGEGDKPA
ncbi:Translin [Naematelia encephala]|uniref:Translin n=1 Tax=Naematelia encephala TaxID=71784 RepID=A0A1Y2BF60_9TREE|nr:Translin [Naematelia encephala]